METQLRVEVTQEYINMGTRGLGCDCPIAIALWKKLKAKSVDVRENGWCTIRMKENKDPIHAWVPKKAVEFITKFDLGYPVSPFSFLISIHGLEKN